MSSAARRFAYPPSATVAHVDLLHGVTVPDPYRWLEDNESSATKSWIAEQQALYSDYASPPDAKALQASIRARQESLYNYSRVSLPSTKSGRTFFFRNTGLQNQDVLYVADGGPGSVFSELEPRARVLLDLNTEYPEGTTSLSTYSASHDGTLLAYGLAHAGSDWVTVKVRDVATGVDLTDETVPWVKFSSLSWTHDSTGFFYSRYPAPQTSDAGTETASNDNAAVCFHRVRTPASEDVLVYATPEQPQWRASAFLTDDGAYVLLATSKGTDPVNRLYACRVGTFYSWLERATPWSPAPGDVPPPQASGRYLPFRRLIDNFDAEFDVVASLGPRLFLKTNLDAPRGRILAMDLPPSESQEWEASAALFAGGAETAAAGIDAPAAPLPRAELVEVLPQHATEVLDWGCHVATDKLVTCVLKDVVNVLRVYALPSPTTRVALQLGAPSEVTLPGPGTVASFSGRPELDEVFFKFVSFTTPGTSMSFNAATAVPFGSSISSLPFWAAELPGFVADDFLVKQIFVDAADGARIPVFLVHKKGLALPAPTLLYAYGGFNISLQPSFSSTRLAWLTNLGGVFALACIRGGGEYGKAWHDAGRRLAKRTCFTDFAAVARHLSASGVTTRAQLAAMGGSNGGLLALAVAQRTPDLFAAVVSQVPVGDLLRFSKFTIGHAWQGEYGFVDDRCVRHVRVRISARAHGRVYSPPPPPFSEDFFNLLSLSPYHVALAPVKAGAPTLPSVLVCTADHDDRVVPLHSFKCVAALQANAGARPEQMRPLLLRVESKAGHGAGKPTSKILDESSEIWTYIARETGATFRD